MGAKTVTVIWTVIGVLFLLTVVTSKPVTLNTAADESDSVEVSSSEEGVNEEVEEVEEVEEPELPEAAATEPTITEAPNVIEETQPPATIALPVAIGTTALPPDTTALLSDTMDPQTSSDGLQMLPDDPSQTSLGVIVSHDVPASEPEVTATHEAPAQDQIANVDVGLEVATDLPPHANDVQQEVLPAATLYPPYVKGKNSHVAVVNTVPMHVSPGVPVCFTFQYAQYAIPHYNPPRGDSY